MYSTGPTACSMYIWPLHREQRRVVNILLPLRLWSRRLLLVHALQESPGTKRKQPDQ